MSESKMPGELVPRGGGDVEPVEEKTAPQLIGEIANNMQLLGLQLPPTWRSTIAKMTRSLHKDGTPSDIIVAAGHLAILRGRPHLMEYIAGDLMLARSGLLMSRTEYESKLAVHAAEGKSLNLLDEQKRRREEREREIDARRKEQ